MREEIHGKDKKGAMLYRITKCSLCKHKLSQFPQHRHKVPEGFLAGTSIQNGGSLLSSIS